MKSKKISLIVLIVALFAAAAAGYYFSSTVKVPDVRGLTVEEAKILLAEVSLEVKEGEPVYSQEYRKGRVVSVENSGKRQKKNSPVEIVESLGIEIEMYQLVGLSQAEAEQKLGNAGVTMKFQWEYSDVDKKELVMAQSIKEGEMVHEEDKVVITVSKGPAPIVLAEYCGKKLKEVKKDAEKLGLKLKIEKKNSKKVDEGKVISQIPKVGTEVEKGDTVTIVVSKGPKKVKVPDLYGKNENQAKKALEEAGLKLGKVYKDYSDNIAKGCVLGQGKDPGEKIAEGSSVSITVSLGKKTTYSKPSYSNKAPVDIGTGADEPVDIGTGEDEPIDI